MKRLIALCGLALALLAGAAAPASARGHGPLLGLTPPRGAAARIGSGNLTYHGGPVMRANTTYAIYWIPPGWSIVSGYRSTINRYFADSAADSGRTTNVYSTETQYFDTTGPIAYSQHWSGSTTAADVFPSNGCPRYRALSVCLTNAQIVTEVKRVMAVKGWTAGSTHAFFMFLPKGAGTCTDARGSACAFTTFCAYHSFSGVGASAVLYANMPYADTFPADCGTGQRPNNTDADDTLNVTSHEHREMINDPLGNAWYDASGYEGSDKCAWTFGSALGSTPTGKYNQIINGHFYWIQEEWSNARSGCVQRGY